MSGLSHLVPLAPAVSVSLSPCFFVSLSLCSLYATGAGTQAFMHVLLSTPSLLRQDTGGLGSADTAWN